jgi:hypothetical protein
LHYGVYEKELRVSLGDHKTAPGGLSSWKSRSAYYLLLNIIFGHWAKDDLGLSLME